MMRQAELLANEILRTVTGPMWHGPALADMLRGLTHPQASARPIASAHTIWELVLHIGAWVEVARSRVGGEPRPNVPPEEDWPAVPAPSADAWQAATTRLEAQHRALAQDVTLLADERLDTMPDGQEYTIRTLLHGIVEHGTYHGGQIALLRKLVAA